MLEQPSIIKRPVLKTGNTYLVGFDEKDYQQLIR
jgi:arsenate reductase-like glutaredoxin family protein